MDAPRIKKEDLKEKMERGEEITIIDARKDYGSSGVKIPGAVRIAIDDLPARYGELAPSREIVAYCT